MALREELWPRDSQPQEPTAYSPSALSEFGVVGGFVVDTGYEPRLTNGGVFTNVAAQAPFLPSVTGKFGVATRVVDAGIGRYYSLPCADFDSRNFTFLTRVRVNDVGASGTLIRNLPVGTGNTIPLWRSGTSFDMRVNGTDYTAAGTFNFNQWYDVEIVGTASSCDLYVDGAIVIAGAAAAAGTVTGGGFTMLNLANTTGWNEFGHLLFCNRALSAADRASLRANPWQLFEERRIVVPVAAAGGTVTIGQASETDTAQAVAGAHALSIAQASETDVALALAAAQASTIGQAAESDTAQALSSAQAFVIGQASETDTAQALTTTQAATIGQAAETDTADAMTYSAPGAIAQASETDEAQAFAGGHALAIGQAAEADSAGTLTYVSGTAIGMALEIDTAGAFAAALQQAIGQATETDLAQAVTAVTAGGTASAAEVWGYTLSNGLTAEATLVAVYTWLSELHLIHGLTAGSPLTVTAAARTAGAVAQAVAEAGSTVTVTRQ